VFLALAHITVVGGDSGMLSKLAEKFQRLTKKRSDQVLDTFRKGIGTDVELVDVRMHQSLSIYVGCQSRKSVHRLDDAQESGNLLTVLQECSSSLVSSVDITSIRWHVVDFDRCIRYFRKLSGTISQLEKVVVLYVLFFV